MVAYARVEQASFSGKNYDFLVVVCMTMIFAFSASVGK